MAKIPVLCSKCGNLFITQTFIGGNAINVTLEECKVSPCPFCGGIGNILDGTYNFIGDSIQLLSGPNITKSKLELLAKILKAAKKRGATYDEVQSEINQSVKELSKVSDILPKNRAELYAFISLLITIIGLTLQSFKDNTSQRIDNSQVINNFTQQIEYNITNVVKSSQFNNEIRTDGNTDTIYKADRNQPCPCGSGLKFKKCHGK